MKGELLARQHFDRLASKTTRQLSRKDLADWIQKTTFLNNRPFSFKNHEFQEQILKDESPSIVIMKSAQLGLSEMSLRMALGLVMLMPRSFAIGYTFPTASFASHYSKTRFDPIVRNSPTLQAAVRSTDLDNSEVKGFGPSRFIYFKGAAVGNAAISDSLDMLIHDELDFSDMDIIGDYTSRLIHSDWKMTLKLSTPTFPGGPIDTAFQQSRRHFNFCRCNHCAHMFIPSYYDHVSIPGYDRALDEITKDSIHLLRYKEAKLLCPNCGKPSNLDPEHREWVCENPSEKHVAAGYKVGPHDAPRVITVPDLIVASANYNSKAKFRQFSLGIPAADAESGLTEADLDRVGVDMVESPFTTHVMGVDLGLTSHFMVGGVAANGQLVVVHYERCQLKSFRECYFSLKARFRVGIVVADIQPYTDLIMALSSEDPNLYGARYVARIGLEIYDVRQQVADEDNAIEGIREVSVNRNAILDRIMADFRPPEGVEPAIVVRKMQDWPLVKSHLTDMKRASAALRNGEFTSVWQKTSKGQDHYHHTLGYLWIASQMRGIVSNAAILGSSPVSTFKLRALVEEHRRRGVGFG